jgi:hypothetical protein
VADRVQEEIEAPAQPAPTPSPDAAPAVPVPSAVGGLAEAHLLGAQRQALARSIAATHGNRALTALIAGSPLARQPAAPAAPLDQLRKLLDDDKENDAITLMGTLSPPDVTTVLNSADYQRLAVSAFDNDEMYRGVKAMKGDLKRSLVWMFDEGTDVGKVKDVVRNAAAGHEQVRNTMRGDFVDLCDNDEMAEMVDLLKGDLAFKLDWMRAEGTSWKLVRPKIIAAPEAEKAPIRAGWRAFFVDICDNEEMGLAVQLLGGDLEWKLGWVKEEGTNFQRLMQVIAAAPDGEKAPIRNSEEWKKFFISECDDEEMAKVVAGLGGDLEWRLKWMRAEDSNWTLVSRELKLAPDPEKIPIRTSDDWKAWFVKVCNDREMSEAVDLLKGTLLEKLTWMAAEDANWPNLREKLALTTAEPEKAAVRGSEAMKQFFVATCSNDEMADAVTLLGGDLDFKLTWMRAEGADWPRVKALINAAPEPQRLALKTDAWRAFFVEVCSDKEMAEAVGLLGFDLATKLAWMEAEDTNWNLVKTELVATTDEAQKAAVRGDVGKRAFFVKVCNDGEMAEAVDLLGGDLAFKLDWMRAEDSSWDLIRQKIAATADEGQRKAVLADDSLMKWLRETLGTIENMQAVAMLGGAMGGEKLEPETVKGMSWADLKTQLLLLRDDVKKSEIRAGGKWVDAFTSVCGDDEMAEAVDILGGDLVFKLSWMKEEGTDWQHVKEKLRAVQDDAQKAPLRTDAWRAFFVDICGDAEMAEAVALIGGDLKFKLGWMLEEGTNSELVLPVVTAAPDPEKAAVAADTALCRKLADKVGERVFEALGSGPFLAAALIDQGGEDNAVAALRAIATSANVPAAMAELQAQSKVDRLIAICPVGTSLPAPAKLHLGIVYRQGGCTVPQRKKLIQRRYNVEISDSGIGGNAAVTWGQPELDAVYDVLEVFPDGSVLSNKDLDEIHLVVSGIGTYYPAHDAIHLPGGGGYNMATAQWGNAVVVENHFRGTIRHETGHAIDELIHGKDWYMSDPNIDWDVFGSVGGWIDAMAELGGWGPVGDDGDRDKIRSFMKGHFGDASVNAPLVPPADPNHPFNTYAGTCPIVQTANLNQLEGSHNQFMAMPVIGGRVFTRRPTYGEFYSYQATARVAPVYVSNYGLSAPADWFAEQVREYLRSTPPGANTAPFVANYFRMNLP